ncbi:helix-turn-helix transcriptional regulator [Streptomyces sp. ML-6]|uniref:helix-turn-helix domain-containing protein n=1 Tax=Streptomyces sp. ML-6 TaxID=2982693 RepID=UPI0024C05ADC|nr:helix-turn-helix transcriptional regulator [Streptomyces sp. ML-6]MDK0520402.1 helix-turn-helix transcriptional regulator [Streptomyces sp. ML-6]
MVFASKELDPTESPFKFLGSEIRRVRGDRGLTVEQLADLVFVSKGYISQFETAARTPDQPMIQRIDAALQAEGHLLVVYRMATRAGAATGMADYFAAVGELEPTAKRIDWYGGSLFPGLLQTPEYATAITRAAGPFRTPEEVQDLVDARLKRAQILDRAGGPQLLTILDESVLKRRIGTPAVMRGQLLHVASLIRASKVVLQVLPFAAGAHPLLSGQLIIMRFRDAPPIAYVEAPHTGTMMEKEETVDACLLSYDLARAAALSPEASLQLIESAAEEYRS